MYGDEKGAKDKTELSNGEEKKYLEVISEVSHENKVNAENKLNVNSKSIKSDKHNHLGSTNSLWESEARQRRFSITSIMSLGNSPIVLAKDGAWYF